VGTKITYQFPKEVKQSWVFECFIQRFPIVTHKHLATSQQYWLTTNAAFSYDGQVNKIHSSFSQLLNFFKIILGKKNIWS
jgi:hypothetical protein